MAIAHTQPPVTHASADRLFRVLNALRDLGPGAHHLGQIAQRSDLHLSTVCRLLQAAVQAGWATQDKRGGLYKIAPAAIHTFDPSDHAVIPPAAREPLITLQSATSELLTVHQLSWRLFEPVSLCTAAITGGDPALEELLARNDPRGCGQLSLQNGAAGLAMLAALRPRARNLAATSGTAWTAIRSQSPVGDLDEVLEQVADRGYAHTTNDEGHDSLAVAMVSAGEACGAVCLTAPTASPGSRAVRARRLQASIDYIHAMLAADPQPHRAPALATL
jgi:DNA-binding IclR family transcriptional regulator